jgi:hypothetical protein
MIMGERLTRKEIRRIIDEAMLCEICGLPDEPENSVEAYLIPDKGSRRHKLHTKGCKDKWLAIHPRKFHEGGRQRFFAITSAMVAQKR